jgi:hypothetical protein
MINARKRADETDVELDAVTLLPHDTWKRLLRIHYFS